MNTDLLARLIQPQTGPCISIYTTNVAPPKLRDLRLRALLDEAGRQLVDRLPAADREAIVATAGSLFAERIHEIPIGSAVGLFVTSAWSGIAVIAHPLPDTVSVAGVFAIRPLLESGWGSTYRILALHGDRVTPLRGVESGLSVEEALPTREQARHHHLAGRSAAFGTPVDRDHSKPIGSGDVAHEALRAYFHVVAAVYRERHPQLAEPVILAGTERNVALFREAANGILPTWPQSIPLDLDREDQSASLAHLLAAVRPVLEQAGHADMQRARHRDAGRPMLTEAAAIIEAAAQGQVETLLLVRDAKAWGNPNGQTGSHASPESGDEDLLDRATVDTLRNHGRVRIVNAGDLGAGEKAVAVLRYLVDRYQEETASAAAVNP